jgi:hypothetical protein
MLLRQAILVCMLTVVGTAGSEIRHQILVGWEDNPDACDGCVSLAIDDQVDRINDHWKQHKVPSLFDLSDAQCEYADRENCSKVFVRGFGLAVGWQPRLMKIIDAVIRPGMQSGAMTGVFIGDESCGNMPPRISNCWPDYSVVCAFLQARLPKPTLYVNEGAINNDTWSEIKQLPSNLTHFSVDRYDGFLPSTHGADEVDSVRKYYQDFIFPRLPQGSSVFAVPGIFACSNDSFMSLATSDEHVTAKLISYQQWASHESRLAGFMGWHLTNRSLLHPQHAPPCDQNIGAVALPLAMKQLRVIGALVHKPPMKNDDFPAQCQPNLDTAAAEVPGWRGYKLAWGISTNGFCSQSRENLSGLWSITPPNTTDTLYPVGDRHDKEVTATWPRNETHWRWNNDLPAPPVDQHEFNVREYGALGDGKADDRAAIQRAFDAAASRSSADAATIVVPPGTFLVKGGLQMRANQTTLQIDGRIVLPTDPADWPMQSDPQGISGQNTALLRVVGTEGVTVTGSGELFGSGERYWIRPRRPFPAGCHWWHITAVPVSCAPALLIVNASRDFVLDGLLLWHPPGGHIGMHGVRNAVLRSFTIRTPGNASDTDGIDTTHVDGLYITNASIFGGDDNIAIKNDTKNVLIDDSLFGSGHGASIGSIPMDGFRGWLGIVRNITMRRVVMNGTAMGVRVKTWQNATGCIKDVRYEDLHMIGVGTVIEVNAFYCQPLYCDGPLKPVESSCCGPQAMAHCIQNVLVQGLVIERITGSATEAAGSLTCSSGAFACRGIIMRDISIDAPVGFKCQNAAGTARNVTPASCLKSDDDNVPIKYDDGAALFISMQPPQDPLLVVTPSDGNDCKALPIAQHFYYNASTGAILLIMNGSSSKDKIVGIDCCSPKCDGQRCGAQPHPEPVEVEGFTSTDSVQFKKWKNVVFDLSHGVGLSLPSLSSVQIKLRKSGKCLVAPATPGGAVLDKCESKGSWWNMETVDGGAFVLGTAAGACATVEHPPPSPPPPPPPPSPPPPPPPPPAPPSSWMHCPLDAQATQIVAKLNAYYDWAINDTRIVGFNPWCVAFCQ